MTLVICIFRSTLPRVFLSNGQTIKKKRILKRERDLNLMSSFPGVMNFRSGKKKKFYSNNKKRNAGKVTISNLTWSPGRPREWGRGGKKELI